MRRGCVRAIGGGGRGGLAHRHRGSSACCAPAARRPHCPTRLERTVGPGPARETARLGMAGGGGSRALLQDAVSTSKARPLSLSSTSTTLPSLSEVPRSVRRRGPRDLTRAGSCGPTTVLTSEGAGPSWAPPLGLPSLPLELGARTAEAGCGAVGDVPGCGGLDPRAWEVPAVLPPGPTSAPPSPSSCPASPESPGSPAVTPAPLPVQSELYEPPLCSATRGPFCPLTKGPQSRRLPLRLLPCCPLCPRQARDILVTNEQPSCDQVRQVLV